MNHTMKRIGCSLILGMACAVAGGVPDVVAQPAAAIGKPLPQGDLPAGTVSVRIVAGSTASPVTGTEVTLLVGGEPRVARTDAAGRATFAGLPAGAMVQAKVTAGESEQDAEEIASEPFAVPAQGGVRVLLSTKPFEGMGGAPGAGGAGPMGAMGMPEARQMSGQPRPERTEPAGSYTVRVTYNNLVMKDGRVTDPEPPVGVPVMLAAYAADGSVSLQVKPASEEGLVTFDGLDQSGGTAYYAMANLPRAGGHDRLIAIPAIPGSQVGTRVVLSGDKRDATSSPLDDYGKLIQRDAASTPPAGKVRITVDGLPPEGDITLIDAATMKPLGTARPQAGAPDPSLVRGVPNVVPRPDLAAGTFEIEIQGGPGSESKPLSGIEVRLVGATDAAPIEGATAVTDAAGKATITVTPDPAGARAVLTVNGRSLVTDPVDLSTAGAKLEVLANWPSQGRPEAMFDVAYQPGQVLFAQTTYSGETYRSLPFATVPDAGSQASVYIYPRTMFRFDTHAFVEDQLFAIQGAFEISNYSWAPYRASSDGLLVKLPKGHKGAIVAPQDQETVAVAQGEGFRIMRPIPPGGVQFRAGFSMPIEHGEVDVAFELPLGTFQSAMKIRETPGMAVRLPPSIAGSRQMASTGEPWFVIPTITVPPKGSFTLHIAGFPREATWKVWAPRIIGLAVLAIMLGGLGVALFRRGPAQATDTEARRNALMDELVELEKRGVTTSKDRQRREQLMTELERLWGA